MKKSIKKILSLTLAITVFASMTATACAATRLAKVTGVKASKTSCEITLKWKKVKKAKKYQIYQYKKSKKKYVRVKTVTRPKTTIKKLKQCKTYKFKIRAIRGSKKGKWSRIISVKTRKPVVHKTAPTNPTDATINLGDTYYIKMGSETLKVKVTSELVEPGTYGFKGRTSDGGTYEHNRTEGYYMKEYCAHGYKTHFDYEESGDYATIEDIENANTFGISLVMKVKDNNTKAYWTLDGTEPKVGQADYTGYSKYCALDRPVNDFHPILQEILHDKYKIKDKYYPLTKLRGTASKGTTIVWTEPHSDNWFRKIKTYNGNKLIYSYEELETRFN